MYTYSPCHDLEPEPTEAPVEPIESILDSQYYLHDDMKNVVALADKREQITATYQYDALGRIVSMDGPKAESNPLRFASEYYNDETGLVEYRYRQYNPLTGRWFQRDPMGEQGGVNLYASVGNDPVNYFDYQGLAPNPPLSPEEQKRNDFFDMIDEAVELLKAAQPKHPNKEIGILICCRDGKLFLAPDYAVGGSDHLNGPYFQQKQKQCPPDSRTLGLVHTHPNGTGYTLSTDDFTNVQTKGLTAGTVFRLKPGYIMVAVGTGESQMDDEKHRKEQKAKEAQERKDQEKEAKILAKKGKPTRSQKEFLDERAQKRKDAAMGITDATKHADETGLPLGYTKKSNNRYIEYERKIDVYIPSSHPYYTPPRSRSQPARR